MNPRHPSLRRFRDPPELSGMSFTQGSTANDLMVLRAAVQEQGNHIRELQWCVAALLDALSSRGMLRLEHGLPTRSRHDEQEKR